MEEKALWKSTTANNEADSVAEQGGAKHREEKSKKNIIKMYKLK
jgi:hypothetical protein